MTKEKKGEKSVLQWIKELLDSVGEGKKKKKSAHQQFQLLSTADQTEFCYSKDQEQEPRQDWAVGVEERGKAKGMTGTQCRYRTEGWKLNSVYRLIKVQR